MALEEELGDRGAARVQLTLKLERTCSARGTASAASAAWDRPQRPSSPTPQMLRTRAVLGVQRGRDKDDGQEVLAERVQASPNKSTLPASSAAQCRGPMGPGVQSRARFGRRAHDPGGAGGSGPARDSDAVTFRDPRLGSGRARARCGPGTRGPARALQAGPLLRGARSTWSAAARPRGRRRPAAAGIGSERGRDRRGDRGWAAARTTRALAGGGRGEGAAGVPQARVYVGAGAGRCGRVLGTLL